MMSMTLANDAVSVEGVTVSVTGFCTCFVTVDFLGAASTEGAVL